METRVNNEVVEQFEMLFDDCMHAIHLKRNMKFRKAGFCVITFSDVMQRAYRVREMVGIANNIIDLMMYDNPDAPIVAEYDCVADMVADGWRVD